ncbi:DUF504 domain-containing protein [Candidatus Bathyarchaeota archaeon]|nr:MAG: DUF504 domain-containing protein [Candidatus Bathyarchaeota archaeon]TMI31052.1 MAG: DUF504 domain-containing protein [Candidatus Bathyarchaeota archaeon]
MCRYKSTVAEKRLDIVLPGFLVAKMGEHPLRQLLSRAQAKDPSGWSLTYRHRGAPADELELALSEISKIQRGSLLLKDGETQIPFHRVLQVTDGRGGVRWRKREPGRLQAPDHLSSADPASRVPP